jgi:hypothetical protein
MDNKELRVVALNTASRMAEGALAEKKTADALVAEAEKLYAWLAKEEV